MQIDARQIFNKVEPKIKRLGFDSYFLNLGDESGPINPGWAKGQVIYEIYVRAFSEEGTFNAVKNALPALKEKGIEIIWFMPIHPIGVKRRKGSLGSYYSVRDFYGINPEFGTLDDFKRLVKKMHEAGLYVIIDLVANHTAWDNPLIESHPDWYTRDENGNMIPPVHDWSDVVDLNYDNPGLCNYMIEMMMTTMLQNNGGNDKNNMNNYMLMNMFRIMCW